MKKENSIFGKNDIIVAAAVFALALVCWLVFAFTENGGGEKIAVVRSCGEIVANLPLDTDTVYTVENADGGINIITVKDRKVAVTESSCPDHICEKTGWLTGEDDDGLIACLPNRLTVTIESRNAGSCD